MSLKELKKDLRFFSDAEKALLYKRFFKTDKGQYGEGDKFIGVTVPNIRKVAKKYKNLGLDEISKLVKSEFHEERMTALIIMTLRYPDDKETFYNLYIENINYINNWDLVDVTCPRIIGDYLYGKPRNILFDFANSENLWKKRMSIISTLYFIKKNDFSDTLKIAEILINDKHDLIQKAVGWMLREVGNKNIEVEEEFLKTHCKTMPRTALRYAIEKFPEEKRLWYLKAKNL